MVRARHCISLSILWLEMICNADVAWQFLGIDHEH
jgi:hypothetical protein